MSTQVPNNSSNTMQVLDHGFVSLVDWMGSDTRISNAARVVIENWRGDDDVKLLNYMMKNYHTSPFEHAVFTFWVKAPIFVFRQWHRHRTWSYNEISARYKPLSEEYYIPEVSKVGIQSDSNHQGRHFDHENPLAEDIMHLQDVTNHKAFQEYEYALKHGVPREIARCVLPVATYSEMFATVDLWNLLHFLELRMEEHAQYEIKVYAQAMYKLIYPIVPVTLEAWRKKIDEATNSNRRWDIPRHPSESGSA